MDLYTLTCCALAALGLCLLVALGTVPASQLLLAVSECGVAVRSCRDAQILLNSIHYLPGACHLCLSEYSWLFTIRNWILSYLLSEFVTHHLFSLLSIFSFFCYITNFTKLFDRSVRIFSFIITLTMRIFASYLYF